MTVRLSTKPVKVKISRATDYCGLLGTGYSDLLVPAQAGCAL